jgi:branched-chain amino acid transport system ATP-binding protein
MSKPKVLMFDELSLGLSPLLVMNLFEVIRRLKHEGLTMLLVEQNVQMALAVSDYAYVMNTGRIETEGEAKQVRNLESVRKAYLGL